jgi:preprotein translocase subunit SecD
VQVVLKVHTDDALRISTEGTSEQLREALQTAGITFSAITVTAPTAFRVESVPPDKDGEFRRIRTSWPRPAIPAIRCRRTYDFTMLANVERNMREQAMVQAFDTIERRVNELGVAEPIIARHGSSGDQTWHSFQASPRSPARRTSSGRRRCSS